MPLTPIDDLIDHLKGGNPYGKTETIKLWEALRLLSDGLYKEGAIDASQLSSDALSSGGTVIAQSGGTLVGTQKTLNFIDMTVTEDLRNKRIDVEMNLEQNPDFWSLK